MLQTVLLHPLLVINVITVAVTAAVAISACDVLFVSK